jgi:hypothetical protein
MNILIIGNGFDLAHGLKTSYIDFLKYCLNYKDSNDVISLELELQKEFYSLISNNIWLNFFIKTTQNFNATKTWIDFEKEISDILILLDNSITEIEEISNTNNFINNDSSRNIVFYTSNSVSSSFLSLFCLAKDDNTWQFNIPNNKIKNFNIETLFNFLYQELRKFTRAFELYCLKINQTDISYPIASTEIQDKIQAEYNYWNKKNEHWLQLMKDSNQQSKIDKYEESIKKKMDDFSTALLSKVKPINFFLLKKNLTISLVLTIQIHMKGFTVFIAPILNTVIFTVKPNKI